MELDASQANDNYLCEFCAPRELGRVCYVWRSKRVPAPPQVSTHLCSPTRPAAPCGCLQDIVLHQDKSKGRDGDSVAYKVLHSGGKRLTLGECRSARIPPSARCCPPSLHILQPNCLWSSLPASPDPGTCVYYQPKKKSLAPRITRIVGVGLPFDVARPLTVRHIVSRASSLKPTRPLRSHPPIPPASWSRTPPAPSPCG